MFEVKPVHIALGLLTLAVFMRKSFEARILDTLALFIPSVEGFRSTPYWDVTRYSWGYGTEAPGATGSITRAQAFSDMIGHLLADYNALRTRVTRELNVKQWAALLSFSYNLGIGSALNIVPTINSGDDSALEIRWKRYIYAGGIVNNDLVERRDKEWDLWIS